MFVCESMDTNILYIIIYNYTYIIYIYIYIYIYIHIFTRTLHQPTRLCGLAKSCPNY